MTGVQLRPHAARWNREQAQLVPELLADVLPPGSLVWDPCAGTGEAFHDVMAPAAGWATVGSEREPEWALWRPCRLAQDPDGWWTRASLTLAKTRPAETIAIPSAYGNLVRDSRTYPERLAGIMDGAVTSLAFNNRMNDRYVGLADYQPGWRKCPDCDGITIPKADRVHGVCERCGGEGRLERPPRIRKAVTPTGIVEVPDRFNYAAMLGRLPSDGNTAGARDGDWRALTIQLLHAMARAVRPGGSIALELKDNDEDGRQYDVHWLLAVALTGMPLVIDRIHTLPVPGSRKGQNHAQRVGYSQLIVLHRSPGRTLFGG